MDSNVTKIILEIIAAIVAIGAAIYIRFIIKSKSNTTNINQKNNIVYGDQAGRDIIKK